MRPYRPSKPNASKSTKSKSHSPSDDDYMSMDFILSAQSFDNHHRGSNRQRKKRKLVHKSQKSAFEPKRKKLKHRMEEERNKGLATPISSSNIGFKLLSKMGYRDGMSSKTQPVEITIRDGKSGLGVVERKERRSEALSQRMASQKVCRKDAFKRSLRHKSRHKQLVRDIRRSALICQNLDVKAEVNLHNPLWCRAEQLGDTEGQGEEDEVGALSLSECEARMMDILRYLREQHTYCYWCGVQYADEAELEASCPGNDRALHDSLDDF